MAEDVCCLLLGCVLFSDGMNVAQLLRSNAIASSPYPALHYLVVASNMLTHQPACEPGGSCTHSKIPSEQKLDRASSIGPLDKG